MGRGFESLQAHQEIQGLWRFAKALFALGGAIGGALKKKIYGKEKQKEYFPAIPFHIFIDLSNYLIMKKRDPAETGFPPM